MDRLLLWILVFSCTGLFTACQDRKAPPAPAFDAQLLDDAVQIGYGLGIGDVDGDGRPDILLADKKQFVWYRNGDWQRFVMVDSLTERDNVCLAVADIDGDRQVEVAVGAQWNPGETSDPKNSGSVHYLVRPADPTQRWEAIPLHHEPTVHRMHWIRTGARYQLVVLPLHGRGNQNGEGQGVRVLAYAADPQAPGSWNYTVIDSSLHMTHNFDVVERQGSQALLVGGREGAKWLTPAQDEWPAPAAGNLEIDDQGFGEIRQGDGFIAGIQPMHGNELAVYLPDGTRRLLTDSLQQGHALACADLLGLGRDQVVAGWREANAAGEVGIKLFIPDDRQWSAWQSVWIDRNGMACEDLKVADLDGDGKADIVAAGRSTNNLKIYWNRTGA